MNYERYIKAVVLGYGCELVGWPKSVNFVSPTNITSVNDMTALRDALKDGTCRWKSINEEERKKWWAEYERQVEEGEIVEKGRRRRSDAGEKRGPNKRTKTKRAAVKKGKGKSKAMSEEEEEDNGEDDEDGSEDNDNDKDKDGDEDNDKDKDEDVDKDKDKDKDEDEDEDNEVVVETSKSKSKLSSEKEKECAKRVKERKVREEKKRKAREERKAKEKAKEKRAKATANKLSGGGRKRKMVDDDENDTEHTAKKSRGGEGGTRKKWGREEDDDEDEEPLAKKIKRPKPRPAYRNAPPASAPSTELPPGPPTRATIEFLKLSQHREKALAATAALKAKDVSQAVGAPPLAGSSDGALTCASSTAPDGASTSASNKVKRRRGGPPGVRFAN
jgi:hypothetical protein